MANNIEIKKDKQTIIQILIIILFISATVEIYVLDKYFTINEEIQKIEVNRLQSHKVISQMKQTSDDLTNMVRLYVTTGNDRFISYFNDILQIRDGSIPRPKNYTDYYWAKILATGREQEIKDDPKSLKDIFIETKFSQYEIELLTKALSASNDLAVIENKAIEQTKKLHNLEDTNKSNVIIKTLFSKDYLSTKARIMSYINLADIEVDKRFAQKVFLKQQESESYKYQATIIAGVGALILVFVLMLVGVLIKNKENDVKNEDEIRINLNLIKQAAKDSWGLLILIFSIAILISGLTYVDIDKQVNSIKKNVLDSLSSTLDSVEKSVKQWINEREQEVRIWANTVSLTEMFNELIKVSQNSNTYDSNKIQFDIKEHLDPVMAEQNYLGYFFVNKDGLILSSSKQHLIGKVLNIPNIQKLISNSITPPLFSSVGLPEMWDENGYTRNSRSIMAFSAAVKAKDGSPIGSLIFIVDPTKEYTEILQRGRVGESGESYAFNRDGLMISESRFNDDLINIGLLNSGEKSIQNIFIKDPGVNLVKGEKSTIKVEEQPLTFMVQNALDGKKSYDIDGYNDYRGVPVIGTWIWNEDIGYGVASEIDYAEAYKPIKQLQKQSVLVVLFTFFILSALIIILIWTRIRTIVDQQRVEQSEKKVKEQSQFFQTLLDSQEQMIITTDGTQLVTANKTFFDFFAVKNAEEFMKEYKAKCICDTFNIKSPEGYLQVKMGNESWIDYVISHSFAETHKAMISLGNTDFIFSVSAAKLPNSELKSAVFTDITEMEEAKITIQNDQNRIKTIVTNLADGLIIISNKGIVEQYSPSAERIFGYQESEVINQNIKMLMPMPEKENHDGYLQQYEDTGIKSIIGKPREVIAQHKNGELIPIELSVSETMIGDEKVFIGLIKDITDRKIAREE